MLLSFRKERQGRRADRPMGRAVPCARQAHVHTQPRGPSRIEHMAQDVV